MLGRGFSYLASRRQAADLSGRAWTMSRGFVWAGAPCGCNLLRHNRVGQDALLRADFDQSIKQCEAGMAACKSTCSPSRTRGWPAGRPTAWPDAAYSPYSVLMDVHGARGACCAFRLRLFCGDLCEVYRVCRVCTAILAVSLLSLQEARTLACTTIWLRCPTNSPGDSVESLCNAYEDF